MRFSFLHKVVAYLLSGLGFLALSLGQELSEAVLMLVAIGYFTSYFVEGPLLTNKVYARVWTTAIVSLLVVQVLRGLQEATLSLALEFAAALQISRLFNRRSAQDYQQIAVLSFLHLIAASVLSTEIVYAVVFAGFVIVTPWMLALSHLRREIEANYPPPKADADPGEPTGLSRVLASRRVVGPRFLAGTALLSLPLFFLTLVIFLAVPRVGQGFLSFGRKQGDKVAGFGDKVELGGFGVIRDDPSVVLRVTPIPRLDARAPRMVLRLRGTSFDHYDGRLWSRSDAGRRALSSSYAGTIALQRPPTSEDQHLRIVLDQLDQPVVFLPEGSVALRVDPKMVRARSVNRPLTIAPGYDVRYQDLDGVGLIYEAFVTRTAHERAIAPLPSEDLASYLQVPEEHDRVAALAKEVTAGADTPLAKAGAIRRFLQTGAYTYSLQQPVVGSQQQPLNVFLFEAKRGHCEYFSSAMAIMLRTLGVPTRNVTGFAGGRYNSYGEYYAIRQGDAHSWVEVYLEDRGWVTFDPTPAGAAEMARDESFWADLHAIGDAIRARWMSSVVGYDLRSQVSMLRGIGSFFRSGRDRGAVDREAPEKSFKSRAKGAALVLLGILVLAVLGWVGYRALRRRAPVRKQSVSVEQAIGLYRELERALVRAGRPRPSSTTPLEHAQDLQRAEHPQARVVLRVTEAYMRARYGEVTLTPAELVMLRREIESLAKAPRDAA